MLPYLLTTHTSAIILPPLPRTAFSLVYFPLSSFSFSLFTFFRFPSRIPSTDILPWGGGGGVDFFSNTYTLTWLGRDTYKRYFFTYIKPITVLCIFHDDKLNTHPPTPENSRNLSNFLPYSLVRTSLSCQENLCDCTFKAVATQLSWKVTPRMSAMLMMSSGVATSRASLQHTVTPYRLLSFVRTKNMQPT